MNVITKIALASVSLLTLGTLTACQSNHTMKNHDQKHMMKHAHTQHDRQISPEQREKFQQARSERKQVIQQIKTACDGKTVGQMIQVKTPNQTIEGTCIMTFKADRKTRGEHRSLNNEPRVAYAEMHKMRMQHNQPLTDARRAELTQQFDQRLAQRQAKQQAIIKACQGQSHGKTVQVKVIDQTLQGTCQVKFQRKMSAPSAINTAM